MPTFAAMIKGATLKTSLNKETGQIESTITVPLEIPMNSEIWEFIGQASGDLVRVEIEKTQIEMKLGG